MGLESTHQGHKLNMTVREMRKKCSMGVDVSVELVTQRVTTLLNTNRPHVKESYLSERSGIGDLLATP